METTTKIEDTLMSLNNARQIPDEKLLRERVIKSLVSEGFCVNPNPMPNGTDKSLIKRIHERKRTEQLFLHRNFLLENLELAKSFSMNLHDINPENIDLDLVEVKPETREADLFFWWNLIWWSLPFDRPIGRQMRFIVWDKTHDAPFGLIGLQSQPFRSGVRDKFLGLSGANSDYWINQSMYAQRVGALPPYNELLGGKMVALSLVSNEIRDSYRRKYRDCTTLIRKRKIPNHFLFLTTSSAFGKSSMYDRLRYENNEISQFIGFTSGAGTFHISESLYRELLTFLKHKNIDTKLGYGTGSSRKLRLVSTAFRLLKMPKFSFHNIRRGYYLFPVVKNLHNVIHENANPEYYDRPFGELFQYWRVRWCLPRSKRILRWRSFDCEAFFAEAKEKIDALQGQTSCF
jgi:hypothetical protein